MNLARLQQLLNGQTAIAQKVYSVLPVNNSLSVQEIYLLVRRGGKTTADKRTVEACVHQLERAGLFIKADNGNFRKARVTVDIRGNEKAAETEAQVEAPPVAVATVDATTAEPVDPTDEEILSPEWRYSLIVGSTSVYRSHKAAEREVGLPKVSDKRVNYSLIKAAMPGDVFRVPLVGLTGIGDLMIRFRYIRNHYSPLCGHMLEVHLFENYAHLYVTDIPCGPKEKPPVGLTVKHYGSMVERLKGHPERALSAAFLPPVVSEEKVAQANSPHVQSTETVTAVNEVKSESEHPTSQADTGPGEHLEYWKQLVLAAIGTGALSDVAMARADAVIERLRSFRYVESGGIL